jgi:hypothetical protein
MARDRRRSMNRAARWSGQAMALCALLSCAAPLPDQTAARPSHRLVGLACGPDKVTLTAIEEDHFPQCETIDTPQALCGIDSAETCARRFGGAA